MGLKKAAILRSGLGLDGYGQQRIIYFRRVCRVRTPKRENCRFFGHAAAAEAQGFRPCLRCRPELAPGLSLVDSSSALAAHAATLLDRAAHAGDDAPGP